MSAINPDAIEKNSTTGAFLSALAVNGGLLLIEIVTFIILKQRLWRIYSPRTVLPPPQKRSAHFPHGIWRWIPALTASPAHDILHKNGLDAYMFLRFIRLLIVIFSVFTIVTFAIIIPANSVHVPSAKLGIERISWTNITSVSNQNRFAAHVITVYILTGFVVYMIRKEMLHFLHMRHQFLISKSHSRLAQARTVLITPVPEELATERDLRTFASFIPGGVDKVWLYRDTGNLNKLFDKRQEYCQMLETAESALLKSATLAWRAKQKRHRILHSKRLQDTEQLRTVAELEPPIADHKFLNELVPKKLRPRHRPGLCGVMGPKVDTIEWCKDQISSLNTEIKALRESINKDGKFLGSAFIRCNIQLGAHVLSQCLSYHEPMWMYNKLMEVNPKDIIWRNLDDGALEMKSRYAISWIATIGLIILWAFPVSFAGALSNLSDLCEKLHWLQWVCKAPPVARGLLEGVLPPLLLAILFALLPFALKALAWYECIPRWSMISVSVYRRYYIFLLIHGFLIVTLSSGITNVIEEIIKNPAGTVQNLSSQLPGAAIFFLTYMVTQGLAGSGTALLQLIPLVMHYLRKWFLGRTPRQAYDVTFKMPSADFGVTLPRLSLLATITFAYSVLCPLINLLALASFIMFYLAWKFLFIQVFDQPDDQETGGMYFPMAMNNLFVGLYIEQICLACLFFLKVSSSHASALVEACFMVALIAFTACAQILLYNAFHPLEKYLPMSLATKKMAKKFDKSKQKDGPTTFEDGEIDLFSRDCLRRVRRRLKRTNKPDVNGEEEVQEKESTENKGARLDHDQDLELHKIFSNQTEQAQSPSLPVIDPASRAEDSDSNSSSDDDNDDDHAFDHPSTYVNQPWIWLPSDSLGLSELLVNDLKAAGVGASSVGAVMDEKGIVEVTRNPPDEDWSGGHDL